MNRYTQFPELDHVLTTYIEHIHSALGDNLLAFYLTGSFALGGGDDDSDVDFMAIIQQPLSDDDLARLTTAHQRIFEIDSYWAHHLEGSFFPLTIIQNNADQSPVIYFDNGAKEAELSAHDNELVVRWVTREQGITLYGAEPRTYIQPIADDAIKAEVRQIMHEWGADIATGKWQANNTWSQQFAVLSYCRMLQTLAEGKIRSKPDAIAWAKANLDPQWHDLIDVSWHARAKQFRQAPEAIDPDLLARTHKFIEWAFRLSETRYRGD